MSEKRILLIVGGGIAAYKSLELVRLLRKAGVAVRPILTAAGAQFITPLSLSALCEDRVYCELFSLDDESEMGHIQLSRSADLMAKAAGGLANDLASTTLLATDKRVLMAPAMNVRMWNHPATQRNRATLAADGVAFVGPDEGAMACGEFGPGRLAEPPEIFAAIMKALEGPAAKPLAGKRAIVTAGPTAEPIDPVRVLTNRSSGKQGFAIAAALAELGCDVTLVAGPVAVPTPLGVRRVDVETAREMLAACEAALPADIAVCVAAVSDWRPEVEASSKMKKGADGPPALKLVENPDILATLSNGFPRPRLVVGFAAETDNVEAYAQAKLAKKGCDWIVANDVSIAGTMGGDDNAVSIVTPQGIERWERTAKSDVARKLAARMAEELS
ncbi:bifunctional phosphopantothenoylcysteine decarboxylase/phosphopantothenate--cysteine ligase CoaBC [Phenylobacterium sp.]|uniref:bifunctional phosphopantothenoylcysteine decarboxylase/phosphopantothenate--cysteine ligase CoaBC n=1 Tax=Phenylobacterium sp. TaxID=1871053 RepID=UPI002737CBA6|nr:bifunctional phosphopantothenoylcysteine decarboxylase/phosphopantothenate--cysteine ligase CoaBC [Phenylobacterium sp.]MDP3867331.1 bifunctional phosphopantothenoylcysteine decarboxylase/phosphopantothenate--cysteine ligase CoaBC [Phenylobacterium sp.]